MNFEIRPSHVAILVPSVIKAADYLKKLDFKIGEVDDFEETREIYIEGSKANSLLLMEPKESGSYRQALNKRGPGLHHLAVDVLNIEKYLKSIKGSGWLLHLNSLQSLKDYQTAYLARPGFPGLIEVQQKEKLVDGEIFVQELSLNLKTQHQSLIKAVGLETILKLSQDEPIIKLQGQNILLKNLF